MFAIGEQIMRAADCNTLSENPKGFFDSLEHPERMFRVFLIGEKFCDARAANHISLAVRDAIKKPTKSAKSAAGTV